MNNVRLAWAVSIGVATLIGTQSIFWGLLAGLALFVLVRWWQPRAFAVPPDVSASGPRPTERATSIEVVCKTVTPVRQEWVSLKTGRLYDVLSANGLAGARPGDRGRVTLTGATWRIDLPAPNSNREEVDAP